jgi:hypothetical protein
MATTDARNTQTASQEDGSSSAILKFLIGTTAGGCATLLPRLVPELSSQNPHLGFLTLQYGIACVVFSVLVGLSTLFWEWNVPKKPAQTFMTALGLPALIAGTLNAKNASDQLGQQLQQTQSLQQALGQEAGIPTLGQPKQDSMGPRSLPAHLFAGALAPRPAYATSVEGEARVTSRRGDVMLAQLGIQIQQPDFVVVLDRAATADEARQKAQALRQTLPDAKAAQVGNEFLVINGERGRPKSDALLDAVRLKNERHLSPSLVEQKGLQLLK